MEFKIKDSHFFSLDSLQQNTDSSFDELFSSSSGDLCTHTIDKAQVKGAKSVEDDWQLLTPPMGLPCRITNSSKTSMLTNETIIST